MSIEDVSNRLRVDMIPAKVCDEALIENYRDLTVDYPTSRPCVAARQTHVELASRRRPLLKTNPRRIER